MSYYYFYAGWGLILFISNLLLFILVLLYTRKWHNYEFNARRNQFITHFLAFIIFYIVNTFMYMVTNKCKISSVREGEVKIC